MIKDIKRFIGKRATRKNLPRNSDIASIEGHENALTQMMRDIDDHINKEKEISQVIKRRPFHAFDDRSEDYQ